MERSVKNYLALLSLALIWGSSFILMKKGLEVFTFIEVATLRITIAFVPLIPFLPKAIKTVKRKHHLPIVITALLYLFMLYVLKQNPSTVETRSLALGSLTLAYMLVFGHGAPSMGSLKL